MYVEFDTKRKHAIREAVFGLQFASMFKPADIKSFMEFGKEHWSSDLPSYEEFRIGPFGPMATQSNIATINVIPGASFQSFKRDGTLSWRVLVQEKMLAINCLEYDGWETVWPTARKYLRMASNVLMQPRNSIAGTTLQYVNAFHWNNPRAQPDVTQLFRADTNLIPKSFWERGSNEWHLYQGWFEDAAEPIPGRMLHRDHLASQPEDVQERKVLTTLVDLVLRYDFTVRNSSVENFFETQASASMIKRQ